jgi:hypothetical protein
MLVSPLVGGAGCLAKKGDYLIRSDWCRSTALGILLLALGVACEPAAPSGSSAASGAATGSAAASPPGQAAPATPRKMKMGQTGLSPASWPL